MKFNKINICSKLNIPQLNDFISKYKITPDYSEDTFLIMNADTMRAIQCEINNMSQKKSRLFPDISPILKYNGIKVVPNPAPIIPKIIPGNENAIM